MDWVGMHVVGLLLIDMHIVGYWCSYFGGFYDTLVIDTHESYLILFFFWQKSYLIYESEIESIVYDLSNNQN